MSYAFPPDVADLVQQVMATGNFGTEDDVLRAALQTHLESDGLFEGIQSGFEDMVNGRVTPLENVDAAMRAKYGPFGKKCPIFSFEHFSDTASKEEASQ